MKELYIDRGITQSRAAIYVDGKIDELYVENHDDQSITGNIYKGRIENIVPGLNAAFVNIGTSRNAILHFRNDIPGNIYKRGNEILVQVIREAVGEKGPRVSEEISIPGKYIVLLPKYNGVYISHKIKDEKAIERLKAISKNILKNGNGIIFRTEAESIENDRIMEEYSYLSSLWENIEKRYEFIKPPEIVFNSRNFLNFIIREYFRNDIDKVYVNRKEDYNFILDFLNKKSGITNCLIEYVDHDFRYMNALSDDMLKLLNRKVLLSSGVYLIIESTEALTTIDVNTGSFTGSNDKEETILKTNKEACIEIYRMVKLLNISGIILIDFINMENNGNNLIINDFINELFKKDKIQNCIYGFTHLGLLEMSRAKKGKPLQMLVYEDRLKNKINISYLLKEIENKCLRYSMHYNRFEFDIYTNQSLYESINNHYLDFEYHMENIYGIKVNFIKSNSVENYIIDRDVKSQSIVVQIGEKKITGELLSYSEENDENIIIRIKKH